MAKATPIPDSARAAVLKRDQRCARCGAGGPVQWHHRRSRRVRDAHVHCVCNGLALCATCHSYVHANPAESAERGLIVSSYIEEPSTIPVKTYRGWMLHTCGGTRSHFPTT
jgi:hypothetical protein